MKFTIQSDKFRAIVKTVEADMDDLRRQVTAVSDRVDDVDGHVRHPDLHGALSRFRDEFTEPVGKSAVAWADAVATEGDNVVVSYRNFDDEAARLADEQEVA